jgi:hypothetical protein
MRFVVALDMVSRTKLLDPAGKRTPVYQLKSNHMEIYDKI